MLFFAIVPLSCLLLLLMFYLFYFCCRDWSKTVVPYNKCFPSLFVTNVLLSLLMTCILAACYRKSFWKKKLLFCLSRFFLFDEWIEILSLTYISVDHIFSLMKILYFWPKFDFRFFANQSILDQNLIFYQKFQAFRFSNNISDFDQNLGFRPKFGFSTNISVFDQHFGFRPKFWFSTNISVFDQNFGFRTKFWFSTNISVFDQNFGIRPKFRFSNKILVFDQIL